MRLHLIILTALLLLGCDAQKDERVPDATEPQHMSELQELRDEVLDPAIVGIRLILHPTFFSPVVYDLRIQQDGRTGRIQVRRYSGKSGYDPGTVDLNYLRDLTENEARLVLAHVHESKFWDLPEEELVDSAFGEDGEKEPYAGLDGDTFTLEGKHGNKFHFVWRWQALSMRVDSREPSDIAPICKHIIELAGIRPYSRDGLTW